jgi:cytochrome c biogenesis protein ResB
MNYKTIAIALLTLAAVAMAADVNKAVDAATDFLNKVRTGVWAASLASVGILLGDVVYTLFVRRRGLPELFGSAWFWVPLLIIMVPIILYIVAKFSPEVKAVYDKMVEGRCPFLYCPQD